MLTQFCNRANERGRKEETSGQVAPSLSSASRQVLRNHSQEIRRWRQIVSQIQLAPPLWAYATSGRYSHNYCVDARMWPRLWRYPMKRDYVGPGRNQRLTCPLVRWRRCQQTPAQLAMKSRRLLLVGGAKLRANRIPRDLAPESFGVPADPALALSQRLPLAELIFLHHFLRHLAQMQIPQTSGVRGHVMTNPK